MSDRKGGARDGDVSGRGRLVLSCIQSGTSVGVISVQRSSKCAKASCRHPSFRHVVSSVGTKAMGYIVMGSLSHFNERCVGTKGCVSHLFPCCNIQLVTVGSKVSAVAEDDSSSFDVVVGGLVGSGCYHSVSVGVHDRLRIGEGGNRFVKTFTPCKCGGSNRSGGLLLISACPTKVIRSVFH